MYKLDVRKTLWVRCPYCDGKTRIKVYEDTVMLNFPLFCRKCQRETMPDFNEKYKELGDDIHFMMVNMTDGSRETIDTATAFIDKNGYNFPVLFDTGSEAAMTYEAYSLPTSFFINAEGHVIAQAVGAIDGETLQKGIDMIMG